MAARQWAIAAVLLFVSACAHHPVPGTDIASPWLQDSKRFQRDHHQSLDLPVWRYSAKVAITTPELREQANIIWQYRDQANNVRLFGPLGAGTVIVDFDRYGVQLSDSKGVRYRGDSAEQLLTEITGWPIPVDALAYWLFVQPRPGTAFRYRLNPQGEIAAIEQAGWQIKYADFRDYGQNRRLPRKLTASKQAGGETVKVKLVTKDWQW